MNEKTKFSKREWIHLIITLSIVQAAIWFVSFVYANNSSALGYISFAGTIISIILAVLAIGYTYGESHQQKNSSLTLANQIESLVAIKDKLEIQAESLSDIKHLKNTLENFSNKVDNHFFETNDNLKKVKLDLIGFGKPSNEDKNLSTSEVSVDDKEAIFFKMFILPNRVFIDLSLILSVLYFEKYNSNLNDHVGFVNGIIGQDPRDVNFAFIVGSFTTTSLFLEQMDFCNFETRDIYSSVLIRFNELVNSRYINLEKQGEGLGAKILDYALTSKYFKKA